jgi:hypothetical protein
MTAFDAYVDYLALKRHFVSDYDYFKYNGKCKTSRDSFEKRNDYFVFDKIGRRSDYHEYLLANISSDPSLYVRSFSEEVYTAWKKRTQSLAYSFREDLSHLDDDIHAVISSKKSSHPDLLKAFLSDRVSLESVCIIFYFLGGVDIWNGVIDDPVWNLIKLRVTKYTPFLKFNRGKMQELIVEKFS